MSGTTDFHYNKALFDSMSQFVDAVWEINLQTESVDIIYDRIEPQRSNTQHTLSQVQDWIRSQHHPDDIQNTLNHLSIDYLRNLKKSESFKSRSFIKNTDMSEETTLEYTSTPEFDDTGNAVRIFITFRNIQNEIDKEHEKESLTQILQMFQMATQVTNTIVFIFNTKEQSILVNNADAENWGVSIEQKGVPYETAYSSIVSPKYRDKYISLHEKMMRGDDSAYGIIGLCNADGEEGLYELTFSRIFDKDGNPTDKAAGIYRNVTEFSREARKSQAIATVLGNDYDIILVINTEKRTIHSHKVTGDLWEKLGLKEGESYNYDDFIELWATKGSHKDDINIIRTKCTIEHIVEEVDKKGSYTYTFRCINNNKEQTLQCTHQRLNGTTDIISSYRNIDAILEYENHQRQAIENALAAAEHANRAKTVFLNNMSHDIRTPMNAIIGFTTLASSHVSDKDKVLDYLNKIHTSSSHLLSLINDVLDMSRIESGKVTIEENEVSLTELMQNIKNIIQADINNKQQKLVYTIAGIQDDTVYCDKLRLNQVLLNCISNSIKFTGSYGTIEIGLTQISNDNSAAGYATYQFRVKDTGIGMSPEFLEHMFEPFERERTSTVSGITGTGLGMAITKNLLDLMDGTIDVKSKQGKGTESTITLTFKVAGNNAQNVTTGQDTKRADNVLQTGGLEGIKILLVEDNALNREIAQELLKESGAIIDTAEDGSEALARIHTARPHQYDVILMDIQMPIMDGYEATRRIRALKNNFYSDIPIIAMTANAFQDDKQKALEVGMNDHIGKPIDVQVIITTITKVLNNA